jgi:hypothetical protein
MPSDEAYARLLTACREGKNTKSQVLKKGNGQAQMVIKGHADAVLGVAITPDGKTII